MIIPLSLNGCPPRSERGRNAERRAFFTLPPDSDRNEIGFYQNRVDLSSQALPNFRVGCRLTIGYWLHDFLTESRRGRESLVPVQQTR